MVVGPPIAQRNDSTELDKAAQTAEVLDTRTKTVEWKNKCWQFGICWNCGHLRYVLTKYGKETAECVVYDRPSRLLSASDPVLECSDHYDRFAMSLPMMWQIATLIEVDQPRVAGFVTKGDENGLEKDKAL